MFWGTAACLYMACKCWSSYRVDDF